MLLHSCCRAAAFLLRSCPSASDIGGLCFGGAFCVFTGAEHQQEGPRLVAGYRGRRHRQLIDAWPTESRLLPYRFWVRPLRFAPPVWGVQ